ncbi:MAG: hypothetical protein NT027_13415 [Proteobacteria bacterium]|nr:hypothetical protein [Pseudomonadota bacterium]
MTPKTSANRIVASSAKSIQAEIHMPFAITGETLNAAEFTLIQIVDEMGRIGIGEASPLSVITGDNSETVLATAKEILTNFVDHSCLMAMATLRQNRDEWFATSPSAYVGVETALWDLFAKQVNLPLAALWGQRMKDRVITDITLPLTDQQGIDKFWNLFDSYKFNVVKIKVSGHVDTDLDRIHHLVSKVPHGTQITLDGNQGYEYDNAIQLIENLSRHNIIPLFFEQPIASDRWSDLKRLESETRIPVCLDETVVSPEDAIRVVQEKTASMINLKITKSGIEETLRIIAIARSAGIALMIGGMLESEIAMGTSLQLACGAGGISHFDLDTPFFFKNPIALESPWQRKNSTLECPKNPGIGLELIHDFL